MIKDHNIRWREKESRRRVEIHCRGCRYEKDFSVKKLISTSSSHGCQGLAGRALSRITSSPD